MVVPFLIFLGPSILFSIGAVPIYIPTNSAQGFPFLHILTNTFYLLSFFLGGGFKIFIYLLLSALGLRCCARAFSSCGERGLLFVEVRGLPIAVASLVAEHGL